MSDCFNHEADAWDSLNDESDDRAYSTSPKPTTCKYCNTTGVQWIDLNGKWRLFDLASNKPHTCGAFTEHYKEFYK